MTSFAPGTNPQYANAYSNWWFGGAQGPPPNRASFGPGAGPPQQQGGPSRQPFGMPAFGGGERGAGPGADRGMSGGAERGMSGGAERGGFGGGDRGASGQPDGQQRRWSMGAARPVPPQSQGTPYGGSVAYPSQKSGANPMKSAPSQVGPSSGGIRAWNDPSNPSGPNYQPQQAGGMFNHAPILPVPQQQHSGQSPWGAPPSPQGQTMAPSFGGGFGGGMPQPFGGGFGSGFGGSWASPPPSQSNVPPGWQPASPGGMTRGAWQQQHQQAIASPANQRWLGSMTPANRQIYSLLQGLY